MSATETHDLRVDVTGCGNGNEICERVGETLAGLSGIARVTLHGTLAEQVDLRLEDLQAVRGGLEALVARAGTLSTAYDFEAIAEEKTVRGQFVRDVRGATDLDEEERRRILVTGLRAFEGRDDLEVT